MNANPVVSVVMAVLNCDRFIEEAIASVLAQTYSHWELLLVDDGSTDRTAAIFREYALRNPERLRYFEHPGHTHRGVSASRNLGITNARGTYIAFLDGDDVYLPFRLERHVTLLEANPDIDMVQSDTLRWYSWSGSGMKDIRIRWPFKAESLVRAPGMLRRSFDRTPRDGFFPSVCSVTLRRTAIDDIGYFDSRFAICEDWAFFSKLYLRKISVQSRLPSVVEALSSTTGCCTVARPAHATTTLARRIAGAGGPSRPAASGGAGLADGQRQTPDRCGNTRYGAHTVALLLARIAGGEAIRCRGRSDHRRLSVVDAVAWELNESVFRPGIMRSRECLCI